MSYDFLIAKVHPLIESHPIPDSDFNKYEMFIFAEREFKKIFKREPKKTEKNVLFVATLRYWLGMDHTISNLKFGELK